MSGKHIKVWRAFNYFEDFLILIFVVSGCVSISAFTLLVGIPVCTVSFAVGLKICALTRAINKYNSVTKRQ